MELHGRFMYFYSYPNTVSLHWWIFRVCIYLTENHVAPSQWIQIFSIHELSCIWFLNKSSVYHLSYAFTLSIVLDPLHLNSYWVYTCEHIFSLLLLSILIVLCVSSNLPLSHCRSPLSQFPFLLSDKSDMAGWLNNRKPFHCSDLFLKENKTASIQNHQHISNPDSKAKSCLREVPLYLSLSLLLSSSRKEDGLLPIKRRQSSKQLCPEYLKSDDESHLEINASQGAHFTQYKLS